MSQIMKTGDHRFVFVAPMYNASKYLGQMLHSIVGQSYDNWELILIDEVSSPEEQIACKKIIEIFQNLLIQTNRDPGKIMTIWNSENGRGKSWEMSNVLYGISKCHDEDIVLRIDADDWLTDLDALAILNAVYLQSNADAIWTAHRWGLSDKNISGPIPQEAKNPYVTNWVSSHLKSFRKRLINDIPYENFTNMNGELVRRAGDQALYLPILHKAKIKGFLPKVFYHYTISDVLETYQTADAYFQRDEAMFLRQRGYVSSGLTWEEKLL